MKMQANSLLRFVGALALALSSSTFGQPANGSTPNAVPEVIITASWMDRDEIVIVGEAPPGVRKITLESRARIGNGAWQPRIVQRLDGQGGRLTFRLKATEAVELLRIRGDNEEPLPASFYAGKTNFNGQGTTYDPSLSAAPGLEYTLGVNDKATASPTREVVESDIWKIQDRTLYFFNQFRGLQVVDLTQVDAPVVRHTLELPASGEQMYVLSNQYVVLLTQDRYNSTNGSQSQVQIVDVRSAPRVVARLPLLGSVQESRMVGTALYVAAQYYRPLPPSTKPPTADGSVSSTYEWGSLLSAFDLADPTAPVAREPVWVAGYGNVVYATDQYLFLASQDSMDYWQSVIHVVDISAPDGTLRELAALRPGGHVADKYKMNLSADVFTVIYEQRGTTAAQRVSVLQTYSLASPAAPAILGRLEVGHGEGLYATRFDGERAYVVTFLRIDPLWVVDLRDPAKPRLSGELQVPGWSTFIYPMGDRLVTIGIDTTNSWKVAVSLFDVADPTKPGLLSKVPLGENSSWSEATYDDKALSVLPEAGLVLVPYQSWGTNGYASRVQLIDLDPAFLKARGVIEHSLQPRRATMYADRILSLSGSELLTVNAADRDHPAVTSELELSWPVNRVLIAGDYLIEVAMSGGWFSAPEPRLHVVSRTNVNQLFAVEPFTNGLPIVGTDIDATRLFVLQGDATQPWYWYAPLADGGTNAASAPAGKVVLSVFDLGALPQLQRVGLKETSLGSSVAGTFTAFWPQKDVIVWVSSGGGVLPMYSRVMVADYYPFWGGSQGGRILTFGVADNPAPRFLSEVNLASTNGGWSFSSAQTAGSLVYLSHQASEFLPDVIPYWYQKTQPVITTQPDGTLRTNSPPAGIWVTKYFLDVVDYADPIHPTMRKPVPLPGELLGLSHQGALLYSIGTRWNNDWTTDGGQYLDAAAYDGVSIALVDSLKLTNSWPRPLATPSGKVWVLESSASSTMTLQSWELSVSGRFVNLGEKSLPGQASSWRAFDDLLVLQGYDRIELYDIATAAQPIYLNGGVPPGWTWPDITGADGLRSQSVYLPLGDYGLLTIPAQPQP